MANKKKLNLASTQANNLIAGLPERREKQKHKLNLERNFWNLKNVLITKMNSTDYKVLKD